MKDKRIEIILKVIERVHTKKLGMQTLIDKSITNIVCYGLSKHNFFAFEGQLIFNGDQEQNSCRIF